MTLKSRSIGVLKTLTAAAALMVYAGAGVAPAQAGDTITRELATLDPKYPMGSIVVENATRNLYYALGNGHALKYKVAIGKRGFDWTGETFVQTKRKNPGWSPTARMRRMGAPRYVPPGPRNPLGVRAIYLGWSEYRIHGTNAPHSIGRAASSGCFRMHNKDVVDLFERVHIGAPVFVINKLQPATVKKSTKQKTALNN